MKENLETAQKLYEINREIWEEASKIWGQINDAFENYFDEIGNGEGLAAIKRIFGSKKNIDSSFELIRDKALESCGIFSKAEKATALPPPPLPPPGRLIKEGEKPKEDRTLIEKHICQKQSDKETPTAEM